MFFLILTILMSLYTLKIHAQCCGNTSDVIHVEFVSLYVLIMLLIGFILTLISHNQIVEKISPS